MVDHTLNLEFWDKEFSYGHCTIISCCDGNVIDSARYVMHMHVHISGGLFLYYRQYMRETERPTVYVKVRPTRSIA